MADRTGLKEKSLLSLYIFEILRKFSSKECPLSEKQIKEKINAAEIFKDDDKIRDDDRKIIPRYVRTLVDHFDGLIVPVETSKNKAAKWYYDSNKSTQFEFGECLSQSSFTLDEINFLVDMIYSSKLVTEKSTLAFIDKLLNFLDNADKKSAKAQYEHIAETANVVKNENQYVHTIFDKLQSANKNKKTVDITIYSEDQRSTVIKNAIVYPMFFKNKKSYVYVVENNTALEIELTQIKKVKETGRARNYDSSIPDKLEDLGYILIDEDDKLLDLEISNDTLFTNRKTISLAIAEKKYLNFKDYKCVLINGEEDTTIRTVIPLTSVFRNGAYYLVAIDKGSNKENSVLIRIDLMEDLKLGTPLSNTDSFKVETEQVDAFLKTDPFIRSKITPIKIEFYIKQEAIQRVWDEFGETAYSIKSTTPFDNTTEIIKALGESYPEHFTKSFTGFEYGDKLIEVEAMATEDEALRWALENADVVELKSPERLRLKLFELTADLNTRYSKSRYDVEQKSYRKVIDGEEFLTYGAKTKYEEPTRKRILNENAYDKVKKLKIKNIDESISVDELEKYINVEELIIEGDGLYDFSWILKLPSLNNLTLRNTSIKNGEILSQIPHLNVLFLDRNRSLENYAFLTDMDISTLYLGRNGKADISALYSLTKVERLVLEEDILLDMDIERLFELDSYIKKDRRHMIIERWIDEFESSKFPRAHSINERLYLKTRRD